MRFLVCGVGSIGERHIRNLIALGHEDIVVYRQRNLPLRTVVRTLPTYDDLDAALAQGPDAALITNPTHLHLPIALRCADAGCHLFLEKPVSHTLAGIPELETELTRRGRHAMVGFMLRFHPCIQLARQWVAEGRIGRPLLARVQWGEYLPAWHPWEDYRESYASRREMGGGPTLTLSHELDLLYWFFGEAEEVVGMAMRASDLEVNVEHAIGILARYPGGVIANVQLDFVQRPPARAWECAGTDGRISFDYYRDRLELFHHSRSEAVEVLDLSGRFKRNDMFVAELEYWIGCLTGGTAPRPSLSEGAESLRVALLALRSAGEG